jgi:hypothetical protein
MNELVHINSAHSTAGIVQISLNRPDARNALNFELIEQLEHAVKTVAANSAARVLVLSGNGKSFCAGMDLRGVLNDAQKMGLMLHGLARVGLALRKLSIPVIANVQGAAVGGGCGLVVACDFAFTHEQAKLGYPEVDLGVCPAVVAPFLISKVARALSFLRADLLMVKKPCALALQHTWFLLMNLIAQQWTSLKNYPWVVQTLSPPPSVGYTNLMVFSTNLFYPRPLIFPPKSLLATKRKNDCAPALKHMRNKS